MSIHVDFTSPTFDPANYEVRTVLRYSELRNLAEGMDGYCHHCGDFYRYDCLNDCGGIICVTCEDSCDECGAVLTFGA